MQRRISDQLWSFKILAAVIITPATLFPVPVTIFNLVITIYVILFLSFKAGVVSIWNRRRWTQRLSKEHGYIRFCYQSLSVEAKASQSMEALLKTQPFQNRG